MLGSGHDTISAGSGNDLFVVGHGNYNLNDTITGTGNDTIQFNGTAGDSLVLNGGSANLHVGGSFASLTIDATGATGNIALDATALTQAVTLNGNGGADTLIGTSGSNDTITALGGANSIVGGSGNDSITVGNGSDTISVGSGTDTIKIGSVGDTSGGTDTITVGANTTVAYQSHFDSTQTNLSQILNWTDTNNEQLDLTAITTANTITNRGGQTDIASAFGSDVTPGAVDYAVIAGTHTCTSRVQVAIPPPISSLKFRARIRSGSPMVSSTIEGLLWRAPPAGRQAADDGRYRKTQATMTPAT